METRKLAQQFIDGVWREGTGESVIPDKNPYSGETFAEYRVANDTDLDEAYRASAAAKRVWDNVNAYAKRTVFENAVRFIEENRNAIVGIIIEELGGTGLKAAFEIGLVIDIVKEAATFPLSHGGQDFALSHRWPRKLSVP